jgi:hypothetical protein
VSPGRTRAMFLREQVQYVHLGSAPRAVTHLQDHSIRPLRKERPASPHSPSLPGVHTQRGTPDPIPNSAVKPLGPMILSRDGKVGQCRAYSEKGQVEFAPPGPSFIFGFRAGRALLESAAGAKFARVRE